jgi:hypothetical protein
LQPLLELDHHRTQFDAEAHERSEIEHGGKPMRARFKSAAPSVHRCLDEAKPRFSTGRVDEIHSAPGCTPGRRRYPVSGTSVGANLRPGLPTRDRSCSILMMLRKRPLLGHIGSQRHVDITSEPRGHQAKRTEIFRLSGTTLVRRGFIASKWGHAVQSPSRSFSEWPTIHELSRHISRRTSATLVLRAQHDQRNASIAT